MRHKAFAPARLVPEQCRRIGWVHPVAKRMVLEGTAERTAFELKAPRWRGKRRRGLVHAPALNGACLPDALREKVPPGAFRNAHAIRIARLPERRSHRFEHVFGQLVSRRRRDARTRIGTFALIVSEHVGEPAASKLLRQGKGNARLVIARFAESLDARLLEHNRRALVLPAAREPPRLEKMMARRQHDVRKLGHLRDMGCHMHEERKLLERAFPPRGARARKRVIAPVGNEHIDAPTLYRLGDKVRHRCAMRPACFSAQEVRPLGDIDARRRACATSRAIAIRFGAGKLLDRKRGEGKHAAFRPDGPDKAVERIAGHPRVKTAGRHGDARRNPRHRALTRPRKRARHPHDERCGDTSFRLGPFGRLVEKLLVPPCADAMRKPLLEESLIDCAFELGGLSEKVLTILEIPDVIAVPEPLGENHAGDGRRKGAVGSGNDGNPASRAGGLRRGKGAQARDAGCRIARAQVAQPRTACVRRRQAVRVSSARAALAASLLLDELGRHRPARVDDEHRHSATKRLGKSAPRVRLLAVRRNRVGAPQNGALQMLPIVIVVVVDPIYRPRRQLLSVSADGIVVEAVRRAVYLGEDARQHLADAGRAPLCESKALRMPRLAQRHHSIGYLVEGLIPRHRLELGINATAFSRVAAPQRHCHAIGVVFLFKGYRESGTHAPTRCRTRRVAANPHRAFVFNRHLHGAVRQTPLAG